MKDDRGYLVSGGNAYWLEMFHRRHDTFLVERIYASHRNALVPVGRALASGLIDPVLGLYHQRISDSLSSPTMTTTDSGAFACITLEEAFAQGLVQAVPQLRPPPKGEDMTVSTFDTVHVRTVEDLLGEGIQVQASDDEVLQLAVGLPPGTITDAPSYQVYRFGRSIADLV